MALCEIRAITDIVVWNRHTVPVYKVCLRATVKECWKEKAWKKQLRCEAGATAGREKRDKTGNLHNQKRSLLLMGSAFFPSYSFLYSFPPDPIPVLFISPSSQLWGAILHAPYPLRQRPSTPHVHAQFFAPTTMRRAGGILSRIAHTLWHTSFYSIFFKYLI